jgi:hypothetical protein
MIGALSARALSDGSARELASSWGGPEGGVHRVVLRPVRAFELRPLRARTSI